jgi:hypothetical protein
MTSRFAAFGPGHEAPNSHHKAHLVGRGREDVFFSPKGGRCYAICKCGAKIEATCPPELMDRFSEHRRLA